MARLDSGLRRRVVVAVEAFADTERGDIRRLHGDKSGILRLRVGDWRVLFSPEGEKEILIRRVLPRGSAYHP